MNITEMLVYQKKDSELIAIERDIANSQIKKIVNKMVELVKDAQAKVLQVEKNAADLVGEFEQLEKAYNAGLTQAEKLSKVNQDCLNEDELKTLSANATALNGSLLNLEKNMEQLSHKIAAALGAFEGEKKQGMMAKQKHAEGVKAYNEFLAVKQPVIDKLNQELAGIAAKLSDKSALDKYNKLRGDRIFPVYVPIMDKSCGGCSMELPSNKIDKLKAAGYLECENCRRIIYLK
ncbi:MAG: C4-type zinc ribbon domain-containing protein [Firmicutes bacterium]|nr:C4-type zinc ribbon domain-containing protein [Bacillota bacterium]